MNSDKYIFKKKLSLRRKSKRRLFIESSFMFIFGLFLVYINYLIPNKNLLIQNFLITLNNSFLLLIEFFLSFYKILQVLFIFVSPVVIFLLILGSFNRIIRIAKSKNKKLNYKRF